MNEKKRKLLEDFRDLKIDRNDLLVLLKQGTDEPVIVFNKDLILVLEQYMGKKITQKKLLEWVNTIGFSDLYKRCEYQSDSLGSVIYELEELDERSEPLSVEEVLYYIDALKQNKEI